MVIQPSSAASKVFGVTELLELIITHLPHKDLLLLQRVSKQWQSTIAGWTKYEEAICFKPTNILSDAEKKAYGSVFGHVYEGAKHLSSETSAPEFLRLIQPNEYILNPMFNAFFSKVDGATRSGPYEYKLQIPKIKLLGSTIHDVYLTQPPVTMVELTSEKDGDRRTDHQYLRKKTGVTLGDLLAEVSCQISPFPILARGDPHKDSVTILASALQPVQAQKFMRTRETCNSYHA